MTTEGYSSKPEPRAQRSLVNPIAMLSRGGPGANITRTEPAPLERELVVIVPVARRSPESCARRLPLFSSSSFSTERHIPVIQPHIIEIDMSARQESQWVDRLGPPETGGMVGRIVKLPRVVQDWPNSE